MFVRSITEMNSVLSKCVPYSIRGRSRTFLHCGCQAVLVHKELYTEHRPPDDLKGLGEKGLLLNLFCFQEMSRLTGQQILFARVNDQSTSRRLRRSEHFRWQLRHIGRLLKN